MKEIELNTQVVGWDDASSYVDSETGFYVGEYNGKHLIADGNMNVNMTLTVTLWDYVKTVETPERDEELYDMVKALKDLYSNAQEMIQALDDMKLDRRVK
ncbi:MAG: hypothetical protein GY861_16460 [bacterium]|nr:hypothetical protein [bacterium]